MKDRDFDRLLEGWAEHETASAPDLGPTPTMYQSVRALKQARKPSPFFRRWLALSAAAAALVVLAIIYPALFPPSPGSPGWSGHELQIVGLREMDLSEKGAAGVPTAEKAAPQEVTDFPKRGKKGQAHLFRRLEFQFRIRHPPTTASVDIRRPREEAISLTPDDTYRLLLEPVEDLHVYVFQLSPPGILIRLFPNETYSPSRNPLKRDLAYHLPPEPNWFHLGPHKGEERLYLLASQEPLSDLDSLYAEYTGDILRSRRRAVLSDLLRRFESVMAGGRDQVYGWVLPFQDR